jgi:hypothetical protein
MKDIRFNKAIQDLKNIRMTGSEKQAMLARIVATPVAHASSVQKARSSWTLYSFGSWIGQERWVVASLALIVIIGSSGVASAAAAALPGNTFYPVKVDIIEPIQDVLAMSAESQATWQATKAERRIQEASTLALQDKLDEATQADIEIRLDTHTKAFDRALEKIRESGDEDRADEISVAFQASLGARAQVLEVVADDDRSSRIKENHSDGYSGDKRSIVASLARSRAESVRGSRSSVTEVFVATMMSVGSTPTSNDVSRSASKVSSESTQRVASSSFVRSKKSASRKGSAAYVRRKTSTDKIITDVSKSILETEVASSSLQGKIFDTTIRNLDEARMYIRDAEDYQDRGEDDEARIRIFEAERAAKEAELIFKEGLKSRKSTSRDDTKKPVSKRRFESLSSSALNSIEKSEGSSIRKHIDQEKDRGERRSVKREKDSRKED